MELLDKPVTPLPDFSLEQYLQGQSFSYPVSPEPIRLKIRLPEGRGWHLKETRLSLDQNYDDLGNGMVEVTADVADTLQLRFWLNGFDADMEVMEPTEMREDFAAAARKLARTYCKKP